MHPHALDIRLAGDVRHHRGVDLSDVNEAPLEAEFASLLDDQANTTGRRCIHADDVRFLSQNAEQDRVEVGDRAFEELLRHHLIPQLLGECRLDLDRPPAGVVVRRDRGHALDLGSMFLDPFPEGRGFRRRREAVEGERVLRADKPLGVGERQVEDAGFVDRFFVGLGDGTAEDRNELHVVLGDQSGDRGDTFGDHIFVVVGDDLELVLLAVHVEPALGVGLVEDEIDRVLVRNPPGGGGARKWRRDSELDHVGCETAFRTPSDQRCRSKKRRPIRRKSCTHLRLTE